MRPRIVWRSRKLWEQPGLFLLLGGSDVCLIPVPRGRAHG